MSKVKLNLSVDEEIARWLKVHAATSGLTVSEVIEQWVKERMQAEHDDYGGDSGKWCIYCGRKFEGHGAICPNCRYEPTQEERERMAELWRQAKEELDRLIEKWKMERT